MTIKPITRWLMRLFNNSKPKNLSLLSSFVLAFSISTFAQIVVGPGSTTSGGGGGSGTVTQVDTTAPIGGGPITTTGTLTCATCGVTGSPLSQFAATTSAQLAGVITNESGSGLLVFNTTPTFTTSFLLESTGVSFSAADGVLTILGLGDGNDENLTIDLDNGTANRIVIGSGTAAAVLGWDPGADAILSAGTLDDGIYSYISRSATAAELWGQFTGGTNTFQLRTDTSTVTAEFLTASHGIFISSEAAIARIDFDSNGVRQSATDGILTFLGLGDGNDEVLTIDLDNAAANTIQFGTSTGVTSLELEFGATTTFSVGNLGDTSYLNFSRTATGIDSHWLGASTTGGTIVANSTDSTITVTGLSGLTATLGSGSSDPFLLLGNTGVRLSGIDGKLTILGLGNGNDENLTFDLDNAAANAVNVGTDTGVDTLNLALATTTNFRIGAAGVLFTTNDGILTLLGIGAGADENLVIDLDSFTNVVAMSSGTGATRLLLSNLANVDIATAGVRLSGSDGILTLLGLGNGNDENLVIDFDNATANEINFTSSTGVLVLDFGTLIIEASYNSQDGSAGVTGATCTAWKNGLCTTP